ncbi:fused MFS/spermidine synthase [Patescibacteria group bacterium]
MKQKYILEITVFVCGAVVMIFELVGSRILGPYFGTSIFVWTSLIGIVLGSLSLGYYYGGIFADRSPYIKNLALIIFLAAVTIGLVAMLKGIFLTFLMGHISGIKISSIIASIVLFAPVGVLLGMVSPYAAKIKLDDLNSSASTIGNLYAISTLGSISGTFLAGFYLIPHFGTNKLLIILAIILLMVSFILSKNFLRGVRILFLVSLFFGWIMINKVAQIMNDEGFNDIDTEYSRIWIYDAENTEKKARVRIMGINNENHSSMFLDSDELVNDYTKFYHLARFFNPDFKNALMLGGAGYSYPKDFLRKYQHATIDVVEIDPKVTDLARKHFRLKDDPRLNIFHEDGRVYLNQVGKKYDVIFGDAFSSRCSVPYHMTTREFIEKEFDALNDEGVVILNLVSSLEGEKSLFLNAEYATYKSIFPQVFLFPVMDVSNEDEYQNIILVALKSEKKIDFKSDDLEIEEFLGHLWRGEMEINKPILTDDYAPVDYYINKIL